MPTINPDQKEPLDDTPAAAIPAQEVIAQNSPSLSHGKPKIQPLHQEAIQDMLAQQAPPRIQTNTAQAPKIPKPPLKPNARPPGTVDARPFKPSAVAKFVYCLVAWLWLLSAFFAPRYPGFKQIGFGLLGILLVYVLVSSIKGAAQRK